MSGGYDIRTGGVDLRVNGEGCAVDRILPFHHLAVVVYQNQIGDANLAEVHAERIDPEMIEVFGVAGGDVSGDAFIESEAREQAEGSGQALLAVLALLGDGGKGRRSGNVERILRGNGHGRLQRFRDNYSAGDRRPQRAEARTRTLLSPRWGSHLCHLFDPRLAPWATF